MLPASAAGTSGGMGALPWVAELAGSGGQDRPVPGRFLGRPANPWESCPALSAWSAQGEPDSHSRPAARRACGRETSGPPASEGLAIVTSKNVEVVIAPGRSRPTITAKACCLSITWLNFNS
jgi:hypothetical protein